MIEFAFEHEELVPSMDNHKTWLRSLVGHYNAHISEITYVFTTDEQLLNLNQTYLDHDYYTDILTFDRSEGMNLSGDIFISLDRVRENAKEYGVSFEDELRRVMVHGILHMLGIKDNTDEEREAMKRAENAALELFHVKQ